MITFDEDRHKYFAPDGRELLSVTTLIARYLKPIFDRETKAQGTALKRGIAVEEVLKEWDEKRTRSQVKGDRVHAFINNHIAAAPDTTDPFLNLNAHRTLLPEERAFTRYWDLAAPTMGEVVHTEFILGDLELGIAGTVDCIVLSPATGKRHIWDWKTGSFNLTNKWDNCLAPFSELNASELVTYSMQVSLYRLMLERSGIPNVGESYLLHLSSDGLYTVHKALDLRDRLLAWLIANPISLPTPE